MAKREKRVPSRTFVHIRRHDFSDPIQPFLSTGILDFVPLHLDLSY